MEVDEPAGSLPLVTILVSIANVAAWFAVLASAAADPQLWREAYRTYGFVPADFNLAALPTSLFMHAGIMHLAGNVYFLIVFGRIVEAAWGPLRFAALYLAGGLLASLAHWAVYPDSTLPVIGASGAIAALMGAVAVAFPSARMNLFAFLGPLFAAGMQSVTVPAGTALLAWFIYQSLMFALAPEPDGVAWVTHLAGFAVGALAAAAGPNKHGLRRQREDVDDD